MRIVRHFARQPSLQTIETLEKMEKEAGKRGGPDYPHCYVGRSLQNGHRHRKQQYLCRECGKSFVRTIGAALYKSHSGEAVWKQVIRGTVKGIPIDQTTTSPGLHY